MKAIIKILFVVIILIPEVLYAQKPYINAVMYDTPLEEDLQIRGTSLKVWNEEKKEYTYTTVQTHNGEYIELCNPTDSPVDISGWKIMYEGTGLTFPPNTIIEAWSFMMIVYRCKGSDFELKQMIPPIEEVPRVKIIYHSEFVLPNYGTTLALLDSDRNIVDRMTYDGLGHKEWPPLYAKNNRMKKMDTNPDVEYKHIAYLRRKEVVRDTSGNGLFSKDYWTYDYLKSLEKDIIGENIPPHLINLKLSSNQNYIHTRTYTKENKGCHLDAIQYFDGLGRPAQTVQANITPDAKDLVAIQEYDNIGRITKTWLPAGVGGNNGAYKNPNLIKEASKTTNTNEGIADANPYYENIYEQTPLGRLSQEKSPGQEWQSGGKAIKTEYLSNTSSGDLYCKGYNPNELFVTKYTNEDNSIKYVFKDKQDQTVLVRIMNGTAYNTYYKYDSWGNLIWVLPPEINEDHILFPGISHDDVRQFAYHYIYDAYNRCIAKKAPGSDYTYFIYDKTDQLIFSQDANQRNKSPQEWTFYIHDELGRVVLNGTCNNTFTYDSYPLNDVYVKAVRLNETNSYKGYSLSGITLVSPKILAVNYYDDYGFMGYNGFPSASDANFKPETIAGYGAPNGNGGKGFLTGTMSAKLDQPSDYMVSAMYYDHKGRLVQKKSNSILSGGIEKEYIAYNFIGQPVKKLNTHLATGKTPISEFYTYEYDNGSRLKRVQHQIQENITMLPGIILLENKYDDLGRLINSKRNNSAKLSVDLKYNVRSWITEITNLDNANKLFEVKLFYNKAYQSSTPRYGGDVTAMYWSLTGDKKRGYKFAYDNLSRLTSAQYLENDVNSDYYKIPLISYDKMGNIISIERWGKKADGTAASSYGIVDKLSMTYNGNQLTKVTDTGANVTIAESSDFKDYSNNNGQYTYDFNGNMITDNHKGILGIRYNSLNLPEELAVKNLNVSGKTYYTYSASGAKLKTVHMNSTNLSYTPILGTTSGDNNFGQKKTTEYVANKIYENGVLKRIIVDGGYYDYAKRKYIFFLSDHLGNNRVVVDQNGTVLQKNHFYPFGMAFAENSKTEQAEQPYKYSNKELDQMHGLNLYDLTARSLDPAIGRFTTPDPLSEKYYSWSPYAYVMNNPLKNIDPTGMWIPGPNGTLRAEENDSFQTLIDYLSKRKH